MGENDGQKSNIFAAQDQAAQQQVQGQGQAQSAQAPGQVKTSTEGSVEPAKAQAGTSAAAPQMPGRAAMQIAKKRGSSQQLPGFLSQAQQSLAGAQQGLKEEANKYVQNYQSQNYGLGEDVLKRAAEGDQEAYQQTAQRLAQQGPGAVQAFRPSTQTSIQDIENLRTDAGIRQMLGRQAGGQYTGGESALDLAIMRRNPQFNLIREQLLAGQSNLQKQAQEEAAARTQEAQNIAQQRYGEATQQIQQGLGSQAEAIRAAAEKRAAEENALRKQMATSPESQAYAEQQGRAALEQLRKEMAADPRMAAVLTEDLLPAEKVYAPGAMSDEYSLKSKLGEYYRPGGDVTYQQMIQAPEAERFNRIMGLLGKGGQQLTPQEQSARQGFDTEKLRQELISGAQAKRTKLDEQLNTNIQGILNAVGKRESEAGRQQKLNLGEIAQPEFSDVYKNLDKSLGKSFAGVSGKGLDAKSIAKKYGINPMDYTKATGVNQYSTLTKQESDQLKQYYRDLGQQIPPDLANAGSGTGAGYKFDREAFQDALRGKMEAEYRSAARSKAKGKDQEAKIRANPDQAVRGGKVPEGQSKYAMERKR